MTDDWRRWSLTQMCYHGDMKKLIATVLLAIGLAACGSPAQTHTLCMHETIHGTTYSQCVTRTGNTVTYTFTETRTWHAR